MPAAASAVVAPVVAVIVAIAALGPATGLTASNFEGTLRSDLERKISVLHDAYRSAPGDADVRRAYADGLFKLGNVWAANDVIAPLATPRSSHLADLHLGSRTALLTGAYARAETLMKRLREVAEPGSEEHTAAIRGLVMVAYQTNEFAKAAGLALPDNEGNRKLASLLTFMRRFDGRPYAIEWNTHERTVELEILNDIAPPGALPLVEVEVNGIAVRLILDTGGDRLFLDEAVAEEAGIREIAQRTAKYAYTKGETVTEPLGVAERVVLGDVSVTDVPVIVAQWKRIVGEDRGDGVLPTQILKQFLTTVDYQSKRITLRERSDKGRREMLKAIGEKPYRMPFFLSGSHLMFAKGSLNGRSGMNFLIDSGLAASMPLIIVDEAADDLGVDKVAIEGTPYYWSPLDSHGLGEITRGGAQALGNVLVEEQPYWKQGFFWDALLSHQFLRHLGSWTIDFDTMSFYFPGAVLLQQEETGAASDEATELAEPSEPSGPSGQGVEIAAPPPAENQAAEAGEAAADDQAGALASYAGTYEVAPGTNLVLTVANGKLHLRAGAQNPVPLEPLRTDVFEIKLARATIVFRRDQAGAVTGLVLSQHGFETEATKR